MVRRQNESLLSRNLTSSPQRLLLQNSNELPVGEIKSVHT